MDTETIDILVKSRAKLLMQLLADEQIELSGIAPSFIPQDILITPVPNSFPLLDIPAPPSLQSAHSASMAIPNAPPSSLPLSYIDKLQIVQPQPARPISALSLGSPQSDPLHTPTFQPVSSPPAVTAPASAMVMNSVNC